METWALKQRFLVLLSSRLRDVEHGGIAANGVVHENAVEGHELPRHELDRLLRDDTANHGSNGVRLRVTPTRNLADPLRGDELLRQRLAVRTGARAAKHGTARATKLVLLLLSSSLLSVTFDLI